MHHIATRSGEAELFANDQALGRVAFKAEFYDERGLRSGSGSIDAGFESLWKAFNAGHSRLCFDDGTSAEIVIIDLPGGATEAEFRSSGPWPGI